MVRADAIKMLTDMSSNLNDIYPFILEIIRGGLNDHNPFVKQVSLISLFKLFSSTEISFSDYKEEIQISVFDKFLVKNDLMDLTDATLFQMAF